MIFSGKNSAYAPLSVTVTVARRVILKLNVRSEPKIWSRGFPVTSVDLSSTTGNAWENTAPRRWKKFWRHQNIKLRVVTSFVQQLWSEFARRWSGTTRKGCTYRPATARIQFFKKASDRRNVASICINKSCNDSAYQTIYYCLNLIRQQTILLSTKTSICHNPNHTIETFLRQAY